VRPDDQVQRVVAISGDSRKTLANFFRLQVWPMSRSIRTAIATMAFGFLIERFDLFIRFAAPKLDASADSPQGRNFADLVGFGLVVLGMAMIAVAALRFFRTAKQIASDVDEPAPGVRFDLTLAALLVLLGCSLLLYLPHMIRALP
jgi:putative membrane protein